MLMLLRQKTESSKSHKASTEMDLEVCLCSRAKWHPPLFCVGEGQAPSSEQSLVGAMEAPGPQKSA